MKRNTLFMCLVVMLMCVAVSCGNQDAQIPDLPDTDVPTEPTAPAEFVEVDDELRVDDVVECFDPEIYYAQVYDEQMIDSIKAKIELEGDIVSVVHITNQNTAVPTLEWTYIYELSDARDAEWLESNRREYVSKIDGGVCVRRGNVVVFGNSPVIATLNGSSAE
ncbi:MAG: hypothetical protein J6R04_01055 [Clostridia bacterium]|nr:hypothetical protein [Clostridia bacterium]